jgi:hypothetical protein
MALKLIEPHAIEITGVLPKEIKATQAYYLGYGRNAWRSTWTNIYMPRSISFSIGDLKESAERQRVQGSVFRIESIPALVLKYPVNTFAIVPINDRSKFEYDALIRSLDQLPPASFWSVLPPSNQNWVLAFALMDQDIPTVAFRAATQRASSSGSQYPLIPTCVDDHA